MAILVTNDDGYTQGLKILLNAAKLMDKESYAIIPDRQRSGISKAIILHKPLRINKKEDNIHEISSTPADCVTFSLFCQDFKRPDLVLSGINWGDNTSLHSIYSSGTLAACLQATLFDVPAIGFSLYKRSHSWREENKNWGNKQQLQKRIIEIVKKLRKEFTKNTFFSVNFPEISKTKKIEITEPQRHRFNVRIDKRKDPDGKPYYWITGPKARKEKGKDFALVHSGKITITPITLDAIEPGKINSLKKLFGD